MVWGSYQFSDPVRHCGVVMLVAHWLYLAAAVLGLFVASEEEGLDSPGQ